MKFEIKFNEEIYTKQLQLLYDIAYSNEITYYKKSNYIGFALLFVSLILLYNKPNFFAFALLCFAFGNLIPYYVKFFKRKSLLKRLNKEKQETINLYNKNPISTWEFFDNSFKYSDFQGDFNLEWKDFAAYKIIDETIFLFTKTDKPFIFGKIEIGKENYEKIIELVESKIKTSS
ncbi:MULTISPECIES: hypothetical protein [Flavobacterium]|uniref:hypothetical protein n=1 Tax=Flavobacterium TaxID=237 RepID=UPI001FCBE8AB|nr:MULTISPECIES: hypothetical protein [Flavobacterium]UOK42110.1 hypothetical protein LZF87_12425 [Flavobacterium enshiense]